jgi:hypothetical protein|tara:strand:- start:53 stop:523 length:471 start_codon:yes stop_codon:yes gene_type:complete
MAHNPAVPLNDEVTYIEENPHQPLGATIRSGHLAIEAELHQPVGPTSKAGRLAMELAIEKKRLTDELKELQAENDDLKSTTPTGTIDWYVKWVATVLSVSGIFLMSAGFVVQGQIAYILSAVGWVFVGMQWSDRAIMIGSSISATAVMMNFVNSFQ